MQDRDAQVAEEILRWALYREVIKRKKHTKKRKLNTGAAAAGGEESDEEDGEGSDEEDEDMQTQTERMPDVAAKQKQMTPVPRDVEIPADVPSVPAGPTEDGGIRADRYVRKANPYRSPE